MFENRTAPLDLGPLAVLRWLETCTVEELAATTGDYRLRADLAQACYELAERAYVDGERAAVEEIHDSLALIYEHDFTGVVADQVAFERQPLFRDIASILEKGVLGHELARISEAEISDYPHDGREYVRWLKARVGEHPAGWHPLYHQHIAEHGSPDDLRLLLAQETNLDPRFDDILASMQMGRVGREKLEIASNYWDEMGNGDPAQVHTTLFSQALDAIGADAEYIRDTFMLEAGISGNLSACLGLNRHHYFKSVGYFGLTEYLAPRRFRCVVDSWRRHDLDEVGIVYHDLHIGVDAGHAAGWFKNVVVPLIEEDPRIGREIAIGAMIRLNTSNDYLDALLALMEDQRSKVPATV